VAGSRPAAVLHFESVNAIETFVVAAWGLA
jgi:hypothetical protein